MISLLELEMKNFAIYLSIIFVFVSIACSPEDEFTTYQSIRVVNHSNHNINKVTIIPNNWYPGNQDTIEFSDIAVNSSSLEVETQDLSLDLEFFITISDTTISTYWAMPRYVIDPSGSSKLTRSPSGEYSFGIFSSEETGNSFFIGLLFP